MRQERAAHVLVARPNEAEALETYEETKAFPRTVEAGPVALPEDVPNSPDVVIPDKHAASLRERLIALAKLAKEAVTHREPDAGTCGVLDKVGLISAAAGLLAPIPGRLCGRGRHSRGGA